MPNSKKEEIRKITAPLSKETVLSLRAGEQVLLSGVIYTARDAAHARFCAALDEGRELPLDLRGQTIFYAGPTPAPAGKPIGSVGPTTSARMDAYTPRILRYGVNALIGKGERNETVREALRETGAVYFTALGGCAAYMAACVNTCDVVAYEDLGTESVKRLTVTDLPLTVAADAWGGDAYAMSRQQYFEYLCK